MYIRTLWVDKSIRRQGWGRRLMEMAEAEAIKQGCTHSFTDMTSYQAPEFYKKLGYIEYAKMENFPPGSALHYVIKKLLP
jgi:N-acylglucosamine-6-phosphate 2-epimerase